MRKPCCINRFLLLATIIFLLAGLQHKASEVLAANFATQDTAPTAAMERTDNAPPQRPITHPEVPRIHADEVKELLAKKADFVIVDTNPADSFDMWHIPTAVNMPYSTMMYKPDKRASMVASLPKDKLIVIYCLCEEGADSSEIALLLRGMGYRRDTVKVLEGGLIQWDAKGYPMIKNEAPE